MSLKRILSILLHAWILLFGLAILIAGFLRSASFSKVTAATEIGIAIIGLLILTYGGRGIYRATQTKGPLLSPQKQHVLITATIATILIFVLKDQLSIFPTFITLILTAGYQAGDFFHTVIDSIFVGKYGLDAISPFFAPIPWLFQIAFLNQIFWWLRRFHGRRRANP